MNNESITICSANLFPLDKKDGLGGYENCILVAHPLPPLFSQIGDSPFYKLHNTCMYNVYKLNAFIERYTHKFYKVNSVICTRKNVYCVN